LIRRRVALGLALVSLGCGSSSSDATPGDDGGTEAASDSSTKLETSGDTGKDGISDVRSDAGGDACAPHAFTATTTLEAETSNDSSASSSYKADASHNAAPGNVSKVPTRSLLPAGSTTKIYAHVVPWWGESGHIDNGTVSTDPTQVKKMIDDMMSRGLDGLIVDWYGEGSYEDDATKVMMDYAATKSGFVVGVMEDKGAIDRSGCSTTATCTDALIADLKYVHDTYESKAYLNLGGRPAVFEFGLGSKPIDWPAAESDASTGDPVFVFESSGGFTKPASGGAFAWVQITPGDPTDWGKAYLDDFYDTGLAHADEHAFGGTWKGFDDALASWGSGRVVNQDCGQTWLRTFDELNAKYPKGDLESLQLVTWNDYEEGTEIETGIDNCFSVDAPTIATNTVKWATSGDESTIDHYEVFVSDDGARLMRIGGDVAPGVGSAALDPSLSPGKYGVFVKAIGKPSILNHMSPSSSWTSTGACP